MNERLKAFVDKFASVGGMTFSEKQQKFVLGLEVLVRAEQRVATLQKFQIDMVEKEVTIRSRLTQIDLELRPQSIDRGVIFEGTTQTEEIRESRKQKLQAEKASLQALLSQIERNINEGNYNLREAQTLAARLRRSLLPQIDREITDQ